jgi:ABC-2 type transport system permease protein
VVEQELRDLWFGGRGLALSIAFSVLMSVVAYLVATNRGLNFLEHRETVNLTLQVAVAVGALLALLAGGDAVSGERERGTLESLLLSPVSRLGLTPASCSRRSRCGRPPSRLRCRTSGSSAGASGSSAIRS